jgi:AsmA protein
MKKVAVAAALVVAVLAGVVFVLPMVVGSSTVREALERQLSAAAGADVTLDGSVRFSVFPDFGIVANEVGYVADDGSMSLTATRILASATFSSLFSDQINITAIELVDPRLVLLETSTVSETQPSQTQPSAPGTSDIDAFQMAAGYLERLAIDEIRVNNGSIVEQSRHGARPIAEKVELRLAVPGAEQPTSFQFAGTLTGTALELEGEVGSLRDLLNRQPAAITLAAKSSPPPHPVLADINVSAQIQLADDGSYRIADGVIESAGQEMRLDAAYTPGERDQVALSIKAGALNFTDLGTAPASATAESTGPAVARDSAPDLSPLREIDIDFDLEATSMQVGDALARDVVLKAALRDGLMNASLQSSQIAGGAVQARLVGNFSQPEPEISGALNLASIEIDHLAKLAGRPVPASGRISTDLQFAFYGLDPDIIRESLNLRGTASIAGGTVTVPQLADVVGPAAAQITNLDAEAGITDLTQAVTITGTATWNGENTGFVAQIPTEELFSEDGGTVILEMKSRPVEARFAGRLSLGGTIRGDVGIQAPSIQQLLRWVGQSADTPFDSFAYSGSIVTAPGKLSMESAQITLDDMVASGSLTVQTEGKTTITANVAVNAVDFAKLTGGDSGGGGGASSGEPSGPTTIDLTPLRQFDADIRLTTERIGYGDLHAGPANATLTIKDGNAHLNIPSAGLYGGTASIDVSANNAENAPHITATASLAGVSALPLLIDAAEFERLEGNLNAELAVAGTSSDTSSLARSLSGNAKVQFADGAIRGIDVAKVVNSLQSLISSGYQEDSQDRTEFAELSASLAITDGVARTEDLRLQGPFVRMDGSGSIDLAAETIDMRLNPRVVASMAGQGGEFDVSGLGLPVIVTGPLAQPRIYPDVRNILSNPQQALQTWSELRSRLGNLGGSTEGLGDALKDSVRDRAGQQLENLLPGVIDGLSGGNRDQAAEGEQAPSTRDLVGGLLQGVLGRGRQAAQPPVEAPVPATEPQLPPQPESQALEADPAAPNGEVVLGTDVILPPIAPIPLPDPRTLASTEPAAPTTSQEAPLAEPAVEEIAPQSPQKPEPSDPTADLIKGLINQLGQ